MESYSAMSRFRTRGEIGIVANVLPLAVSGGFGTQNCQTKIKLKWNTKI
jgi:hypothetical protein